MYQEKTTKKEENNKQVQDSYKSYDYEFVFKINNQNPEEEDQIICQRYFHIRDFNSASIKSKQLKETFDNVVNLIDEDLKSKTRVYLYHVVSPFVSQEQLEEYQAKSGCYKNEIWIELTDEFNPSKAEYKGYGIYEGDGGFYNTLPFEEKSNNYFIFEFKIRGNPVLTRRWSADYYPKYIRNSIDIANHQYLQITPTFRVKFEDVDEMSIKYEQSIKKRIHQGREDLIPKIITMFRDACEQKNSAYSYYK